MHPLTESLYEISTDGLKRRGLAFSDMDELFKHYFPCGAQASWVYNPENPGMARKKFGSAPHLCRHKQTWPF